MEGIKECDSYVKKEGAVCKSPSVLGCDNGVPKLISFQGRLTGPTRRSTKGGWTEEEDKILTFAVQEFNCKNWKKIAECVPDRTDVQCLHRWQKVLNPNLVKGPWSKEEDELIIELVAKQGNKKWSEIAKSLPGRIGKQCRERWHNHLNPDIKRTAWTKEEELTLIKSHQIYGNKWAEIAKFLHGRTENSIKNHWNCSVRKKVDFLYLARGSDPCYHKTKAESRKSEEVKQISLDQKVNLEASADTFSLDLVLGTANGRESNSLPSNKENYRSPKRGKNDLTKTPPRTIFDDGDNANYCGLSVGQRQESSKKGDTDKLIRESHHTASRSNELCNAPSIHQLNFQFLDEQTHEPDEFIDPTSFGALSGPLQFSFSTPSDVHSCKRITHNFLHELPPPVTARRLPESSYGPQVNVCSADNSGNRNSKSSPISFRTPPSHSKGETVDSILRSAARSFKNTPSIIRKRSLQCSRKIDNANPNYGVCSQEEIRDNFDKSPHLFHLRPCDRYDINSVVLTNEKQLFLPPSRIQAARLGDSI